MKGKLDTMKLIFIDTETTGWDTKNCALLQISGYIDIDGQNREVFDYKLKPFEGAVWMEEAVDKTGITEQIASQWEDTNIVFNKFIKMLEKYVDRYDRTDKFFFVAYNANFDTDFLREWFIREATNERDKSFGNGFGNFFWTPPLDVMLFAAVRVMKNRHLFENFKLGTVCNKLGIEFSEEDAHNAMYDIEKTRELFYFLKGSSVPNISDEF